MSSGRVKQMVVPRKRSTRNTRASNSAINIDWQNINWENVRAKALIALKLTTMVIVVILAMWAYDRVAASPVFQLHDIQVAGNARISSAEIEKVVHQNLSSTLLTTNLRTLQQQLQSFTWVKNAQITRILPDTLRIHIEERKPIVLVRFEAQKPPVWLDDEGVVLGEYDNTLDKDLPPLVFGFSKENNEIAQVENKERVALYKRLMQDIDKTTVKYSSQIEEIDLSNLKDVRVQLSKGAVEVDLGDKEFYPRLTRALDILDALRHHDMAKLKDYKFLDAQILEDPSQIRFISVVHPTQVAIRAAKPPQTHPAIDKVAHTPAGR